MPLTALLVLVAAATPAPADTLMSIGPVAAGTLAEGASASTRDSTLEVGCAMVLRPATVVVAIVPSSPTDEVLVDVQLAIGETSIVLTATNPMAAFAGMAPDSCITPVVLTGLSVAGEAAFAVADAATPPIG
jgi:hypothetical protein